MRKLKEKRLILHKIHRWFGRTIALLGIAQIPLGLTLYGSPLTLFVLYALAVFLLLLIYFILNYLEGRRGGSDYDGRYSYGAGSAVEERRRSSGLGGLAKAGIAGIGLAALSSRFRHRSRSRGSHPEVVGSRRQSGSYIEEEKYSRHERDEARGNGWKDRFLKYGAIAGGLAIGKRLMDRRNRNQDPDRDRDSDVGEYGPPLGGATPINPDVVESMEEGRPLPSGQHPLNQTTNFQRSTSSLSYHTYMSATGERRRGHGLRNTVAGLGVIGLARNIFKNSRERKRQRRLKTIRQREIDEERNARTNNQRFTGDGLPRRAARRGSATTSTDYSASTDDRSRPNVSAPPPLPAGVFPPAVASAAVAGHDLSRDRHHNASILSNPTLGAVPPTGPVLMPPIPPDPYGIFHPESSGSEAYVSAGGRQHRRHHSRHNSVIAAAVAAGATAGVAVAEASSSRRDHRHSASGGEGSAATPPVSVKVKMHPDGRHVTLRRLPEEEAAADRTRRSKDRHGRRRRGSISSLSGSDGGGGSSGNRYRRTEALERQQADAMRIESENLAAARGQSQNLPFQPQLQPQPHPYQPLPIPLPPPPPPPPIHESSLGLRPGTTGSVGSPGTYDGTATDASANYSNNRRRRRAERAQAKLAREGREGNGGGFT